jgi:hypothetical protein
MKLFLDQDVYLLTAKFLHESEHAITAEQLINQ